MGSLEWMAWTVPTAVFFGTIALILAGMTVWHAVSAGAERRGFLPIATTRGDRLFIGLLGSAFIHLAWIGLTGASLWWALGIAMVFLIVVLRWG
jgi:predicted small integral membrane protein